MFRILRAFIRSLVITFLIVIPTVSNGNSNQIMLYCPVTKSDPLLEWALKEKNLPDVVKAIRFTITITPGARSGLVSTVSTKNIDADIIEEETRYIIYFNEKRIEIDRMTGEFHFFAKEAKLPLGSGFCAKIRNKLF